jgi:hypothetical protein
MESRWVTKLFVEDLRINFIGNTFKDGGEVERVFNTLAHYNTGASINREYKGSSDGVVNASIVGGGGL